MNLGLDGVVDRPRRPTNISRGRLRQNIFPGPPPSLRGRSGVFGPDGRGGMELRNAVEVGRRAPDPSIASSTGVDVDVEGQRYRGWQVEVGEEMG